MNYPYVVVIEFFSSKKFSLLARYGKKLTLLIFSQFHEKQKKKQNCKALMINVRHLTL